MGIFGKINVLAKPMNSRGQSLISLSNLTRMKSNSQLTRNAILYISLGFTQPSTLQILSLRKGTTRSLEMVVYDGVVYIGAHYDYSARLKSAKNVRKDDKQRGTEFGEQEADGEGLKLPARLDVVRVQALLHAKNQPLCIVDLEILQTGLFDILGREIITLQDYMKRRRFASLIELEGQEKDEESSKPSKHVKESEDGIGQIQEPMLNIPHLPRQLEKTFMGPVGSIQSFERDGSSSEGKQLSSSIAVSGRIMAQSRFLEQQPQGFLAFQSKSAASENLNSKQPNNNQNSILIDNPMSVTIDNPMSVTIDNPMSIPIDNPMSVPIDNPRSITIPSHSQVLSQPERPKVQTLIENKQTRVEVLLSEQEDSVQIVETQCKPKRSAAGRVELSQLSRPHHCKKEDGEDCMLVKDLYERMHRLRIVCRVNHIENFMSLKGNYCVKMMLIDQAGDQIFCILYDKAAERKIKGTLNLLKGRTYIFENGEVEREECGALSLSMPWSGIHETKALLPSFQPAKMFRVGQLDGLSADYFVERVVSASSNSINSRKGVGKQLNVVGIFLGMRDQPKLINSQFKVVGALCDCDQQRSINFSLFVSELTSFPREPGVVLSLHNMRVLQHQGTYRLESTKRSYYLLQNHNEHRYMADLVELSRNQQWKLHEFKNMSEIVFVGRKVGEMQELLIKMLEGDHCYSEIDCNVVSITETKEYQACLTCKKNVKQSNGAAAYCYFCKRVERWGKRFLFTAEVADSTSSINVKFSSDEIEGFVNMAVENYAKMTPQSRHSVLELSTYQNLLLRVKSEKGVGGSLHYVVRVQRVSHARSLQEIKDRAIEDKTRYNIPW